MVVPDLNAPIMAPNDPGHGPFVALIALPIELLFLILLYSLRPEPLHRSPYPSASAVLGGSVPLFLFYWFIAAAVGSAMDNVDPEPNHGFLLSPFAMNANAIAGVIIGYIIVFGMEFRALRKHPEAWPHFPQRLESLRDSRCRSVRHTSVSPNVHDTITSPKPHAKTIRNGPLHV